MPRPRLPNRPYPRDPSPMQRLEAAWDIERLLIDAAALQALSSDPPRDDFNDRFGEWRHEEVLNTEWEPDKKSQVGSMTVSSAHMSEHSSGDWAFVKPPRVNKEKWEQFLREIPDSENIDDRRFYDPTMEPTVMKQDESLMPRFLKWLKGEQ